MLPLGNNSTYENTWTRLCTVNNIHIQHYFLLLYSQQCIPVPLLQGRNSVKIVYILLIFLSQTIHCSLDLAPQTTLRLVQYMYKRVFRHVSLSAKSLEKPRNRKNRSAHLFCEAPVSESWWRKSWGVLKVEILMFFGRIQTHETL